MVIQLKVSKDNALIDASYRLSLTEMQIVLYGIGLINPTQPEFPLNYRIDIKKFADMFNRSHGQIYQEVKEAIVKRFWERDFSYLDEKGRTVTLRWLTKMVHEDKSGYIEIKFSEEIQPYLHQLQGNFTTYYIDKIAKFKSIYSVRLYEYSIMYLNKNKMDAGRLPILISEIKNKLGLDNKYNRFCDFKIRVLEKAKNEINESSDIKFDYKIIKLGRSPYKIEFIISRKEKQKHPIDNKNYKHNKISTTALEAAKKLVLSSGTGWDLYVIEQQFYDFIKIKGKPDNLEGAFIGFVNSKIKNKP